MCRFLKISKSTYYFNLKKKEKNQNNMYDEAVISTFKENKKVGTRRLKVSLENKGFSLSRRKIKEIMNKHNLISKYTKLSFKNHHNKINDSQITNIVNRNFNNKIKHYRRFQHIKINWGGWLWFTGPLLI